MDADKINIQVQHSHSGKTEMNVQVHHTSITVKQWLNQFVCCKIHMQIQHKDSRETISEHGTVIIACWRMVVRAVIMVPIVPMVP